MNEEYIQKIDFENQISYKVQNFYDREQELGVLSKYAFWNETIKHIQGRETSLNNLETILENCNMCNSGCSSCSSCGSGGGGCSGCNACNGCE